MDRLTLREILPRTLGSGFPGEGESIGLDREAHREALQARTRLLWVRTLPATMANFVLFQGFIACGLAYYFTSVGRYSEAALSILIASLTDWLDGKMARLYRQETMIGAALDPLRDKVLAGMVFFFSIGAGWLLLSAELISTSFALLLQRYVRKHEICDHVVLKGSKVLTGIQLASFCAIYAVAMSREQGWIVRSVELPIAVAAFIMALASAYRMITYARYFISREKRYPRTKKTAG